MTALSAIKDRRIQFDVLPERLEELDKLMVACDIRTRKELFDNAMSLFEWAVEVALRGNHVSEYNRASDHVEIVRLPVLENAARRARTHARLVEDVTIQVVGDGTAKKRSHLKVAAG